jgi:hypothetical protein
MPGHQLSRPSLIPALELALVLELRGELLTAEPQPTNLLLPNPPMPRRVL